MAGMSNYLENKLIDHLFRATSYSAPATLYIALCTAAPTDASTGSTLTEVSGGNYARQSVTSGTGTWQTSQGDTTSTSSGTNGTTNNVSTITWSGVTWAATVTHVAICDALTAGNVLFWGALAASKIVSSGDTFQFSANTLQIQLDS